ncbi:MAG TPA: acyl-CoA dehydrogenase family protein [Acidimicrobiales bacterium]|nr:acyl-CoA dehydrogenase family protein [Acidimicrobiales bacterium]
MNFDDTPEEAAFRAEVRMFLDAHATPKTDGSFANANYGDSAAAELEHVAKCEAWQRVKYDAGWAGITWPKEYGGRGGTSVQQGIFNQEEARYDVHTGTFAVGIGMAGPTIIVHGTEEQKQRYLDPLIRGEEIWCQLFSEPGAGSDLAGLRTSAVRDGDEWVVNGQKVWNSGAHYSDWGILLTRTDPDAPKHRGITYFLVDMRTPGVDVRPLKQITGASHFNEVFLNDVRIPHANILGAPNAGWGPILTTLANERTLIGGGQSLVKISDLVALARHFGVANDPVVRQELARQHAYLETIRFLGYRVQTAASKGVQPGPESSVLKLAASRRLAHAGNLVLAMQGAAGMLWHHDAYEHGFWQNQFLGQWASRIGGGTDQIQRNIIGENVLGLPSEPRVDKGVPFRDIPS